MSSDEGEEEASQLVNNNNRIGIEHRPISFGSKVIIFLKFSWIIISKCIMFWWEIIGFHFFLDIILWLIDFFCDICSIVNLFLIMMMADDKFYISGTNGTIQNYTKTNGTIRNCSELNATIPNIYIRQHVTLFFSWSLLFLALPLFIISWTSLVTYWQQEEDGNLTHWPSSRSLKFWWTDPSRFRHIKFWWTFLKCLCHYRFWTAPVLRAYGLIDLKWKRQSLVKNVRNEQDRTRLDELSKQIELREQEWWSLQQQENIFEAGPQLLLKIHYLFLHLSENDLWCYGNWDLFFIFVGTLSCTWKVCKRNVTAVNVSRKWKSTKLHIALLGLTFTGHWLSVLVRFILIGRLSASSLEGIGLIFGFRYFICFCTTVVTSMIENNSASIFSRITNFIYHSFKLFFSSFFSFLDFDGKKDQINTYMIFSRIQMAENALILITLDYSPTATTVHLLPPLLIGLVYILSQAILFLGYSLWKKIQPGRRIDSDADLLLSRNPSSLALHLSSSGSNWSVPTQRDNNLINELNNETELRHRPTRDNTNPSLLVGDIIPMPDNNTEEQALPKKTFDEKVEEAKEKKDIVWLCQHYNNRQDLLEIVKELIKKEGNVNATDKTGNTALIWLCQNYKCKNLADIATLLINNGADVNANNHEKYTALHRLCCNTSQYSNLTGIVRLLIEKGAHLNAINNSKKTALHILCDCCNHDNLYDIIDLLLERGATVNDMDDRNEMALHHLIYSNQNNKNFYRIVNRFIDKEAEVGDRPTTSNYSFEKMPIQVLLEVYEGENLLPILELMVKSAVFINPTYRPYTSLHWLCRFYNKENLIELVRSLIETKGIEVDAKEESGGKTPLLLLCENYKKKNLKEIAQLLAANKAIVNATDSKKRTPLLEICKNYREDNLIEIVQYLIHNGAIVNLEDSEGKTPLLELCNNKGSDEIVIKVITLLMDSNNIPQDDPIVSQVAELRRGGYDTNTLRRLLQAMHDAEQKKRN